MQATKKLNKDFKTNETPDSENAIVSINANNLIKYDFTSIMHI